MTLKDNLKDEGLKLRLLYVEDEKDTRDNVAEIFSLFFKEVLVAENGVQALELYKEQSVDLIVTDLTMPKMDGLTLIKEIREINPYQKVIVLSAHNTNENLMETIDLQIEGFLIKPLKIDRMLQLLYKISRDINLEKNVGNIQIDEKLTNVIRRSKESVFVKVVCNLSNPVEEQEKSNILDNIIEKLTIYLKNIQVGNAQFFACDDKSFIILIEEGNITHISKDIQSFFNFSNIKSTVCDETTMNVDFILGLTSGIEEILLDNIIKLHEKLKDENIQMLII